jgi:hypothetical protein
MGPEKGGGWFTVRWLVGWPFAFVCFLSFFLFFTSVRSFMLRQMYVRAYLGQVVFYGQVLALGVSWAGWLAGWLVTGAACALQHYSESQEAILLIGY